MRQAGFKKLQRPIRSFDRISRVYRMLELASFGHALERTREHYLPEMANARFALVLGDGDGRFLAKLLALNQQLHAVAIDTSQRMLDLLRTRCQENAGRVLTRHGDLRGDVAALLRGPGQDGSFDLVVTHFFLDCLSEDELERLLRSVRPRLSSSARWIVSEFRTPDRGLLRPVGRVLIRSLYFAFWLLTGLPVRRMPEYAQPLKSMGFRLEARQLRLGGLLVAEIWRLDEGARSRPDDKTSTAVK